MVSSSAPAVANVWDNHRWSIIRLLSPAVLVVVWQLLSATGLISADVLPAPQLIFDAGWQLIQNGKLAEALEVSGVRVVEGLLLGGVTGVTLGVAVGLSPWVEATVDPPLQMLRALPHLGLIPLFILWFGIGELAKVNLVALGVAFPLYLNTFSAIRQVDPQVIGNRRCSWLFVMAATAHHQAAECGAAGVGRASTVVGHRVADADRRRTDQRGQRHWIFDQQRA